MRNIFYLFILLSLFSCRENTNSGETLFQEDDTIKISKDQKNLQKVDRAITNVEEIRKEHAYIQSRAASKSLDSTTFNYNCNGEKEGKVTYFYEQEQLRLIRHVYNEYSHFSATDEYFIKDGAPFFVFNYDLAWNFTGQNQTQDNITERRFYILNNKAVQCLEKKYTVNSRDENPPESDSIASEETDCASAGDVFDDFELLLGLKEQKGDMNCLED